MKEAKKGAETNEVPVGAVIVYKDTIIARGYDMRESQCDPTAHAEIIAIRSAARYLNCWQLTDCNLYVTLEPCIMCAGAALMARIDTVIYGAKNEKSGGAHILQDFHILPNINHRVKVIGGILEQECASLLSKFFNSKRKNKFNGF